MTPDRKLVLEGGYHLESLARGVHEAPMPAEPGIDEVAAATALHLNALKAL